MVRQTLKFAASLFALSLLGACSSHPSDADSHAAAPAADAPMPEARKPTIFDDQLKALDKAKAVEGDLIKAKEARDKAMDEQTDG